MVCQLKLVDHLLNSPRGPFLVGEIANRPGDRFSWAKFLRATQSIDVLLAATSQANLIMSAYDGYRKATNKIKRGYRVVLPILNF